VTQAFELGLKPIWLIGVGAAVGLIGLAILFLVLTVVHRRFAEEMRGLLRENIVLPVLLAAFVLSLFAGGVTLIDLLGGRLFDRKQEAVLSLLRLPAVGSQALEITIHANAVAEKIPLEIPAGELKSLTVDATESVSVGINIPPIEASLAEQERFQVRPKEPFKWVRTRDATGPLLKSLESLYVENDTDTAVQLDIRYETTATVPEANLISYTAIGLFCYVIFYLLLQLLLPQIAAIGLTTGKEAVSQPLFLITVVFGVFLLGLFIFIPYFTFGDDIKMYKEACLQVIMLLAIFVAIWTSSTSVADEIEGRTALTVLSKPIGRSQFILGKFTGVLSALALLFLLLGMFFVICISYKVPYDARESANYYVTWQDSCQEIALAVPGLILAFMEAAVLASISVAISTRLSILANLIICMGIYVVGHLLPLFVQSSVGEFAIVQFMGQLFATVLPVLEHFNIYGAIVAGQQVPLSYIGWVGGYSLIYISIAMLLALALFDDRDLA
jgi:ABC-type transport system involved in multi-copper enzyme maturation permease subunit